MNTQETIDKTKTTVSHLASRKLATVAAAFWSIQEAATEPQGAFAIGMITAIAVVFILTQGAIDYRKAKNGSL